MDKRMALDSFRDALDVAEAQIETELHTKAPPVVVTPEQHEVGVARIMSAFQRNAAMKLKRRLLIAILAAVLIVLTSCTIYVNREKIAAFVEEFYHTYIDISYGNIDESVPTEILDVYLPTYIPEGYELTESYQDSVRIRRQWENGEGERIVLAQTLLTEGLTGWDQEESDPEIVEINDMVVYCSQYENTNSYMWNDGNYSYKLTTTEELVYEEIEKLTTLIAEKDE